ncbi:MAG: phage minor head protein [Methanosarcinales archaeon]
MKLIRLGDSYFIPVSKAVARRFIRGRAERRLRKTIRERIDQVIDRVLNEVDPEFLGESTDEVVQQITDAVISEFRRDWARAVSELYLSTKRRVARRLRQKMRFTAEDMDSLRLVTQGPILRRVYEGLSKVLSDKINERVKEYFKHGDFERLVREIKEVGNMTYSRADRIARTESGVVENLALANAYRESDPEGKRRYRWVSIPDERRTEWCKKISELTRHGVTLEELREIIKEHGDPRLKDRRPFQVHINCRSTIQPV